MQRHGFEDKAKTFFTEVSGLEAKLHFVGSISKSNTPIGKFLEEALLSMKMWNSTKDTESEGKHGRAVGEENSTSTHYIDSDAIQSILHAFGSSMARKQIQESQKLTIGSSNENALSASERSPRALLHGRLNHYNRVGQNWRFVVDNIRVTKRLPFLHDRAAKRRRHSFWHSNSTPCGVQEEKQPRQKNSGWSAFPECHEIQMLGYNDF